MGRTVDEEAREKREAETDAAFRKVKLRQYWKTDRERHPERRAAEHRRYRIRRKEREKNLREQLKEAS